MRNVKFSVLSIMIISLWSLRTSAQSNDSLKQETILTSWNKNNPYSKAQTKWLGKNSFDTKNYDYKNIAINEYLNNSFRVRKGGYAWAIASALSLNFAIRRDGTEGKGLNYAFMLGSAFLSWKKFDIAKKKIKKAETYRRLYIKKYQSDSIGTIAKNTNPILNKYNFENDSSVSLSELVVSSPYSKSQNNWMRHNGFNYKEYNWNILEINEKLKDGFKLNRASGYVLLAEIPIAFVYAWAVFFTSQTDSKAGTHLSNGPFYVAFSIPPILSLVFGQKAKKKLREAEKLRTL